MEEKKSFIPCRLKNAAVGGHVAGTEDIYDDELTKTQKQINTEVNDILTTDSEGVLARLEALEEAVHFDGEFQTAQIPSEIVSGSEKITTANAVAGALSNTLEKALENTKYFECNTSANEAAKTVASSNYTLNVGGCIKIKMLYANTADNATLTIGSNESKPLYYDNDRASSGNSWEAGETIEVYYDGTNFYANNVAGGSGDGAFDISKYKAVNGTPTAYRTLAEALGTNGENVPGSKRKGGMSVKYIQLTDATYSIVKTEGLDTQPTGTELQEAISIADGTYTVAQLSSISTLPTSVGNTLTYYLTVTETVDEEDITTYTTWVITKLTDDITEYVQWMLKNTQWSIDEKDWVGIDIELGEDKTGTPATKVVAEYAQLREDVIAAALCDLHKNQAVLPDDIMRYNSRKKKILVFGASIEANARSGSGWDVNDPSGWLYWLNKAPYVDTIYNFANGSSCLTSRMTSTYNPGYRTMDNTVNIYWNQIVHALQMYLAGNIETPDVVLISSGGNDIQWTANSRGSIFNDTADEIFSANMNDFNFTGYTDEQVINGDFPDDGADIAEMRVNMLSIAKAVRYISEIIYTYWPETQIIWMGNMYTRGGDIPRANVENRFNEFADKIESCCIKMGIPCIRSDKESGRWMIYEMKKHIEAGGSASDDYNQGKNHPWGFTKDGYHPTVKGAEMFGRYMINKLASVLRY